MARLSQECADERETQGGIAGALEQVASEFCVREALINSVRPEPVEGLVMQPFDRANSLDV